MSDFWSGQATFLGKAFSMQTPRVLEGAPPPR
jgi:hypothetical protein